MKQTHRSRAHNGGWFSILATVLILAFMGLIMPSFAGKHPYQELTDKIVDDIKIILRKHDLPVYHNKENRWLKYSAGTDSWIGGSPAYGLYLYEAYAIPLEAQMEIIEYLVKLHESRGRRETIRLQMRMEAFKPGLFKANPYFEMILNDMQ
ncbi:MAG: hypothetical protein ACLFNV_13095 [Desulfovibrionales bacterium]